MLKFVLFCSFSCTLIRKNFWLQQKLYRNERQNCFSRVQRTFLQKNSFHWKTDNFSITFWFWAKKYRFLAKSVQQSCQKCTVWWPRNTPCKNHFTLNKYSPVHLFFTIWARKKMDCSKNVSTELSKLHFSCPLYTLR